METRKSGLLQNLPVSVRMGAATVMATLCISITAFAGYSGLLASNDGLSRSIVATSAILASSDGDMAHDALRADVLNAIVKGPEASEADRKSVLADVNNHAERFNADMSKLGALRLAPEVQAELKKTAPLVAKYVVAARETAKAALSDRAAGLAALPGFMDAFHRLEVQMDVQGRMIETQGNGASRVAQSRNAGLLQVLLISAVGAVAVLLGSGVLLARSITKPLTRTRDAIKAVVAANLGAESPALAEATGQKDEVAEIAIYMTLLDKRLQEALEMEGALLRTQTDTDTVVDALSLGLSNLSVGNLTETLRDGFPAHYEALRTNYNTSLTRLNQTISQVVQASGSIRGQSDEISRASEDLARRTENQAATLEETAAALDALTSSVKAAADSAREVEGIVQSARREAEDSGKVVLGAVDAMNGIEKSSDQISQIIGVIDDIAFQTNLLALNAGVEAARAGDAGRGFAVVASEVRALAQRSSDASKEIKALISSSSQLVGRGVAAVGSAGKALTTLVDRVTQISALVSEIALGAQEQSVSLGEVNVGVTQLDQVAQKNAAMVEQSMLATQSLRQEAVGLDGLVAHFKTRDDASSNPPVRLRAAS